jgi:DNA mismatch repair ATPase MutS
VLHAGNGSRPGWLARLLHKAPPEFTFRLADRDEAGAQALSALVDRGLNDVANAMAQAADHVLSFFELLRAELGFYVACLNLQQGLLALGVPMCMPTFQPIGTLHLNAQALCDPTLALTLQRAPVSNALAADGKNLVAVTGANQGGKSTFLRSLGLAQLMLHAGLFVAAEAYAGELASGVFTHYKREEDADLQGGKLDEELARMREIADLIRPGAMWLSNESFASTNEREGSELLLQVVDALRQRGIKVALVTHLFEAARQLQQQDAGRVCMLRAQRLGDGSRSFKLEAGDAL